MRLRRVVLDKFSEAVIRTDRPMATIEEALVPAYLMHRYQLQAAGTVLGGRDFTYALKGDGQVPTTPIDGDRQHAALEALLATLRPEALTLDPELVMAIPPRPPMSGESRELFPRETGYLFDPVAAAATASELTLRVLLDAGRAARLNRQHGIDPYAPRFATVLDGLIQTLFERSMVDERGDTLLLQRMQHQVVSHLIQLVENSSAATDVRAEAWGALSELGAWVAGRISQTTDGEAVAERRAHYLAIKQRIASASEKSVWLFEAIHVPPGSPI